MRTSATRIGRTVPIEFGGTVRAVWSRACAVAPDARARADSDPALVTLVRQDVPMTAASIALQLGAAFDFATWGLCVGDRVRRDGGRLSVEGARSREKLEASLLGAAFFDGLAQMAATFDPECLGPVEDAARRHRNARCGRNAFGTAASALSDALLEQLSLATSVDDGPAAERAVLSLVGLGPGLTPSGDDALCGFMLGRRLTARRSETADAAIERVASRAADLTSDVSAVQLDLAARGRFGEALLDVAAALGGDATLVSASVVRCLAEGATSGADGLLGLVAGVRAGHFPKLVAVVRS